MGAKVSIATPERYALNPVIVTMAKAIAEETKATLRIMTDPRKAVAGADAVYTDAWASMGHETEAEERARRLRAVSGQRRAHADWRNRMRVFMHCLPAHRGQEVTDQVIDSLNSVVFDQAENRLHIQKAILVWLLGGVASKDAAARQGVRTPMPRSNPKKLFSPTPADSTPRSSFPGSRRTMPTK